MALPTDADVIVVHGYWLDEVTGQGVRAANGTDPATITFDPVPLTGASTTITPNLRDATFSAFLKTRQKVATLDATTGYFAALLVASNDPDLDAYGGRRVTMLGETPFVIEVPHNATTTTVDAKMAAATDLTLGDTVKAIWLVDAALVTTPAPTPTNSYLTSTQTLSAIADAIEAGGGGGGETTPDATTSTKGKAVILGGTAAAPTVPYASVTGGPTALPPSGGAGGVLGGTYPNPSFAVDMATQTELDAANTANRARSNHTGSQAVSTVSGLQAALDAKTAVSVDGTFTPTFDVDTTPLDVSDVDGLPDALDAKLATTDAPELIRDTMGTALVAGSNVTVTPNDAGDQIVIAATGGGEGGGGSSAPVFQKKVRTSGNVSFTGSDGWQNVDTGLDLTLPAAIGETIEVALLGFMPRDQDNWMYLTAVTLNSSGNPHHQVHDGAVEVDNYAQQGAAAWMGYNHFDASAAGSYLYTLDSSDIVADIVTIRFRARQAFNSVAKSITATTDCPLVVWAKNLG